MMHDAREEAERRYPLTGMTVLNLALTPHGAFIAGAEWQASQSSPDWTDNRDDVARAIALVDSLVDPPLSGKYGRYADAAIAALSAASSARTTEGNA